MTDKEPIKGRFQKGHPGGPGRPPGTKDKITLLRHAIELQLREKGSGEMLAVLDTAIKLAKAGDRQMIKLLLEQWVTKGVQHEEKTTERKLEINVNVPAQPVKPEAEAEGIVDEILKESNNVQ